MQTEMLKAQIPQITDAEAEFLLETAKAAINARRYPFGEPPDDLESRYRNLQLRIAIELYNKSGFKRKKQAMLAEHKVRS